MNFDYSSNVLKSYLPIVLVLKKTSYEKSLGFVAYHVIQEHFSWRCEHNLPLARNSFTQQHSMPTDA